MSKIKLFVVKSMDGFTTRNNGDIDFILKHTQKNEYGFNEFLKTVDCVVFNQQYYHELQSYDMSLHYAELPCYILCNPSFTSPAGKNMHLLIDHEMTHDTFLQHIQELQKLYKNIWLAGDRLLIADCFNQDLIDELTVVVLPVTIKHGSALILDSSNENGWEITEKDLFDNDVIKIRYKRKM